MTQLLTAFDQLGIRRGRKRYGPCPACGDDDNDAIAKGWEVTGNTDKWDLLCKAVNHDTGEYHSTKMLRLFGGGCLIQCDSRTADGQLVRTTTYAPNLPL